MDMTQVPCPCGCERYKSKPAPRMRVSYPGQEPKVVPVPPHLVEHHRNKGWPLPFVELI